MVDSWRRVEEEGLNCQLLVHLVLEELGFSLPKWMRSSELFADEVFLQTLLKRTVASEKLHLLQLPPAREGDIWFFSNNGTSTDNYDSRYFHVAVVSRLEADGSPVLVHARKFKGQDAVVEWGIKEFARSKTYALFQGIRRIKNRVPQISESSEQVGYNTPI